MNTDKLKAGDFGDDVTRLHENLKTQGFSVSPEEERRKFFGPATREFFLEFKKETTCGVQGGSKQGPRSAPQGQNRNRGPPPPRRGGPGFRKPTGTAPPRRHSGDRYDPGNQPGSRPYRLEAEV